MNELVPMVDVSQCDQTRVMQTLACDTVLSLTRERYFLTVSMSEVRSYEGAFAAVI